MNHVDVSVVCVLQNPKDDIRHRLRIIGNQDSLSCVHDEHPCEAMVQQRLRQRPTRQEHSAQRNNIGQAEEVDGVNSHVMAHFSSTSAVRCKTKRFRIVALCELKCSHLV